MSLIVEDGSGVPNADSYASTDDLVAYCTNFGYTPMDAGLQEGYLRRAALEMDQMQWIGTQNDPAQSLAWPRKDTCTVPNVEYGVPRNIKYGQMQLSLDLYAIDQNPAVAPGAAGPIQSLTETVSGAVSESTTYDTSGRILPPSQRAKSNALFAKYLANSGFGIAISRV